MKTYTIEEGGSKADLIDDIMKEMINASVFGNGSLTVTGKLRDLKKTIRDTVALCHTIQNKELA